MTPVSLPADYLKNTDFKEGSQMWRGDGQAAGFTDKTSDLKPGQWVTVENTLAPAPAAVDRAVYFIVPPGEGVIYIKNPSVPRS